MLARMKNLVKFPSEVKDELKKVNWPVKNQVVRLTQLVIFVTLIVSLYLGALDFIFAKIMENLIR
jgi:preprotein translocase subunit SecE